MAPFDDISLIKEGKFSANDYYTFINLFQSQVKIFEDNTYVRYQVTGAEGELETKSLTYGQVDLISSNLACSLHASLNKKTVISILEDHSVYYLILLYTFYKLRIPIQMISTRNSPAAVSNLLKQTDSDCLIYGKSYLSIKDIVLEENVGIECFLSPELNLEELSKYPLNPEYDQLIDQNFNESDLNKIAIMIHSSGTTATPKVVRWCNRYLIYNIQAYQHTLYKRKQFEYIQTKDDVLVAIAPSFHTFGIFSNFHSILSGGSMYFFQNFPPTAKEVFKVMHQENVTRLNAPPYFINQMMHYMQETGDIQTFQKLKLLISGGAATPKETDAFFLKHKINLVTILSMSECFHLMSSEVSQKRVDTNTYFFLEDAEKHAYLEHFDGERYQLIIRKGSPFLATGIQTRENGEYATKDLVVRSKLVENGYCYVGRADDTLVM
ncbi:hypothetical protein HPULCUR_000449 [Helicostylum pulchrum]|uniref:AMP-dependent synthetase/ligase domain-containing protein n=1 Tax=Helicostylum pulchrum TaxID=562976 RepID=A0ABP9XM28_9FUNG